MDYNNKRKVADRVIYIVLTLMVVAIMAITILTVFNNVKKRPAPVPAESSASETTNDKSPSAQTLPDETKKAEKTASVTEETAPDDDVMSPAVSSPADVQADENKTANPDYTLPVSGYITKAYSYDTPVYSLTMNDYRAHLGIDISASEGDPVYAFMSGKVTDVSSDYFMGTCVTVDHGNGLTSKYMNISETLPKDIGVGAEVLCGQLIASVKDTALIEEADETHLHFEILKDGKNIDPTEYVDYDSAATAFED